MFKEREEAKRRDIKEDSLMKYIKDVIRERSTTSETEEPFSQIKMSENKVEQGEESILEIIEESKTSNMIIERLEDQTEKQQHIKYIKDLAKKVSVGSTTSASQMLTMDSTVEGRNIPSKETKNEERMKMIGIKDEMSDPNTFKKIEF